MKRLDNSLCGWLPCKWETYTKNELVEALNFYKLAPGSKLSQQNATEIEAELAKKEQSE